MNKKRNRSPKAPHGACLCQGAGPALSDFLRRLAPSKEARRHFETGRMEILKGLRVLLDARIEQISKPGRKGEKITVE